MRNTVLYHGNDNPVHRFSEYMPSFFTEDFSYSMGYGKHVYAYRILSNKVFDPSVDEAARDFYNERFLRDELGAGAKPIENGGHLSFLYADNFWAFICVEEQIGRGFGYDSMIVKENIGGSYSTDFSVVPFSNSQIEKLKIADFQMSPSNPVLNDKDAEKLNSLMEKHMHGHCHALSSHLENSGIGQLMVVKPKGSTEIIHSFVLSKNGMSIDAGGALSVYEMLQRYRDCVPNGDVSNFSIEPMSALDLVRHAGVTKTEISRAKSFWKLAVDEFRSELKSALDVADNQLVKSPERGSELSM